MEARFKKALRTLIQSANKIRADRTIPEDLKKAFLDINGFLRSEVKKYDEARKTWRSPYRRPGDLLARADAKRQMRDIEAFVKVLKRVMDENGQKRIQQQGGDSMKMNQTEKRASETCEDHQETPAEKTFSNHQGQFNSYHKKQAQVKTQVKARVENVLSHGDRLKNIQVVKVMLVKDSGNQYRAKSLKGSSSAASMVKEFLAGEDREVFLAICLDRSGKINSINIVSIGCLDATIIHPREVFKPAILSNADSIVIAHNHPSGNPAPSQEDVSITKQLFRAAKLMGIKIHEHIIIGENQYTSISPAGEDIIFSTNRFEDQERVVPAEPISGESTIETARVTGKI